jgi:hypothetical protein
MGRALRITSEVTVYGFCAVSAFWPHLPRTIGFPFAIVGFVAMCTQIGFRLHDSNQAGKDTSIRD